MRRARTSGVLTLWLFLAAAVGALLGATPASAQDGTDRFEAALECLARGNLRCARATLQGVVESAPSPEVAYYLAVSERLAGDSVEALRLVDAIAGGEFGDVDESRVQRLLALQQDLRADLAHLEVTVEGPDSALVLFDGAEVGRAEGAGAVSISANPGEHTLGAEAEFFAPSRANLDLHVGEIRRVNLRLEATEQRSLAEEPAFWITLAGAVVLIAAASVLIYALTTEAPPVHDGPFELTEL